MAEDRAGTSTTPHRSVSWLVLLPPVATALVLLVALALSSDGFTAGGGFDAWTLGFLVWDLGPALATAVLATLAVRRGRGLRVVALGGVALLVATAVLVRLISTDPSSTAALGYLTVPLPGWAVVAVTWAVLVAFSWRPTSR